MSKRRNSKYSSKKLKVIRSGSIWQIVRKFVKTELKPLLKEIKIRKNKDKLKIALMNYLIVRTVSIFEILLSNIAKRYVDIHREIAIKLMKDINENISIGDQLVSTYSFMNLKDIRQVFSTFLDKDFFTEVKNESIDYALAYCYEQEHIPYASPLHKNWDKFENIFQLRDKIAHRNESVQMKWKEYRDTLETLLDFMMCMPFIIEEDEIWQVFESEEQLSQDPET